MKITLEPHPDLLKLSKSERIRWAVELETGEYKQAKGKLFDGVGYCCLGVWEWANGNDNEVILNKCLNSGLDFETKISGYSVPEIFAAKSEDSCYYFTNLNDGFKTGEWRFGTRRRYKLNFNQIAQLLRGKSVEVDPV